MSYLLIPIQLDALFLEYGSTAVGQDVHFEKLPWFDSKTGVYINQDKAYLTESIVSHPFQNDTLSLDKGVHLHWALPSFLTTGKTEKNETVFPAVPNRWYVSKMKNGLLQEWIVESDYLWDPRDFTCPVHALCTVPLKVELNDGQQPYAYLGRKYELNEWLQRVPDESRYWHSQFDQKRLTSMGWGSLVFDTFYPNSRSVFGMHDDDTSKENADQEFSYSVIGWYDREHETNRYDAIKEIIAEISRETSGNPVDFTRHLSEYLKNNILRSDGSALSDHDDLSSLSGTLYFGTIDMYRRTSPQPQAENIQLAVANTPAEAISALLIQNADQSLSAGDRLKEEEKLEAMLSFDDLSALQLDVAARLRETRHEKGFVSSEGMFNWKITLKDDSEKKATGLPETEEEKEPVEKVSPEVYQLLNELRQEQYRYDVKKHAYGSALDALYMDWSRYMVAMYPPEGQTQEYPDADLIRFYMQEHSLKYAEQLKRELGTYPDLHQTITPISGGLGGKVGLRILEIQKELEAINLRLHVQHPEKTYHLTREAGTQFWEALPPALVLAAFASDTSESNLLRFSERLKRADFTNDLWFVNDEEVVNEQKLNRGASFGLNKLLQHIRKKQKENEVSFGQNANEVNAWHTFRIEWKVELFPVASGNEATKGDSNFSPSFITQNYMLPEEESELITHASLNGLSLMSNGAVYTGSSYVTDTIKQGFTGKLNAYLSVMGDQDKALKDQLSAYRQRLGQTELLSLGLTGFNNIMLQQKTLMRLAPGDPFGFESHRDFAGKVATLLQQGEGVSPSPSSMFNPVRSGALKIVSVRLVDTFGRTFTIDPDEIITSIPNRIPQKSNWINLPPRLSQQATMSMRWIESETEVQDESKNKLTSKSPVSGWMLPVYLNQRIEFFDASGKHLGAITQKGTWENSVFDHLIAQAKDLGFISNQHLRKVIEWIIQRAREKSFHETFISIFRDTVNNIHPEDTVNPSLMETIAATPIAIAQLAVNLFLKGKPAFDLDWNILRTELNYKVRRNSKAFTNIRFPYILGDFHQYNDGVIAYWEQEEERLGNTVYFNNSILAFFEKKDEPLPLGLEEEAVYRYDSGKSLIEVLLEMKEENKLRKHEFTKKYIKNGSKYWDLLVKAGWIDLHRAEHKAIRRSFDNENLTCSIEDETRLFTLLMHPKGTVHLSTGILPVKKLKFPQRSYKKALRAIELSFLASPIITPTDELNISLHQDSRFEWSWLQAHKPKAEAASSDNPLQFVRTLQRRYLQFDQFVNQWKTFYQKELQEETFPRAEDVWTLLHKYQFVEPAVTFSKEKMAFIKPDAMQEAKQAYDALADKNNLQGDENALSIARQGKLLEYLKPILQRSEKSIQPFETKASAVPELMIREGWLSIKTNIKQHVDK